MSQAPVWVQGRDAVIETAEPDVWRSEVPDYHLSHLTMPAQRTHQFESDSLEAIVERLVQVFEMEASHKRSPQDWVSMDTERFRINVNGGAWADADELVAQGTYNVLVGDSPFYRSGQTGFEESHELFHTAFPGGFFWEVLEVLSPPPVVSFKWRHWGVYEGAYHGHQPTGETIEMFGLSVATVDEDLKIVQIENFYDPNRFLGTLTGGCPLGE